MDELTQEQKYTIAKFYKLYMERSNAGQPEDKANDFKDSVSAQDAYFCDRDYHDFVENCKVLINNGYINGDVSGDRINHTSVTTKTFVEFEQSFS